MQVSPSIDTTHLCFKISILLRPQNDPVWESRCFFFFTKSCCRNLSVFGAVLVVFFVVVVVSVVCWSSRLTMIMTDKALGMKSSPGLCDSSRPTNSSNMAVKSEKVFGSRAKQGRRTAK